MMPSSDTNATNRHQEDLRADDTDALAATPFPPTHSRWVRSQVEAAVGDATVQLPPEDDATEAAVQFPLVGEEFAGFEVIGELGRGGFARVYLARQRGLAGRPVVLKISARRSAESQTLAELQHPNIVPIYSEHHARGLNAVCMPYLGATTLADVAGAVSSTARLPGSGRYIVSALASKLGSLSNSRSDSEADSSPRAVPAGTDEVLARFARSSYVEAVLWLVARMADGLAHAHSRGVVHRDLKPANVLLTSDGQPMLLDFNLAESGHASPRAGGTLPYMAPEHLLAYTGKPGGAVDARSDIYALGLIAYELLAGRMPFETPPGPASEAVPLMIRQRSAGPPDVRAVNPAVSPAAAAVVTKCLAPRPGDRYQTAAELRDDLDAHLAHRQLTLAPNPSPRENARKWLRRHPRATSGWAVGAIAGGVILTLALFTVTITQRAARHTAREQVRQLTDARVRMEFEYGVAPPGELAGGVAAARVALGPYHVLDDPNWSERPKFTRLDASERDEVRRAAHGVLVLAHRAAAATAAPEAAQLAARLAATPAPDADEPEDQADRLTERARELLDAGDPARARALLDRAAQLAPNWLPTRFARGVCLARLGDHYGAIPEFDVCLIFDPGNAAVLRSLAQSRQRVGQWAEAAADLTALLRSRPDDAGVLIDRAICRGRLDQHEAAIADLTAALTTGSVSSRAYYLRSQSLARLGRIEESEADLAACLRSQPRDAIDYQFRARVREQDDPAGSVADLRDALRLTPDNPQFVTKLASLLAIELDQPREALAVLDQSLARQPNDAAIRGARAVLRARLGDRGGMESDARVLLREEPSSSVLSQLAGAYALSAKQTPADQEVSLALLARAIKADPSLLNKIAADPDLESIRATARFRQLTDKAKQSRL